MAKSTSPRCQGKRRMWRGHTFGTFKCGRKATRRLTTTVGYFESHFTCDDPDCIFHVTAGYPANSYALDA